ncbi:MAG: hypothetical protein ABFD49_03770 [Armatimonadota bacterium]|nr:hypothetical protein [bacterium]
MMDTISRMFAIRYSASRLYSTLRGLLLITFLVASNLLADSKDSACVTCLEPEIKASSSNKALTTIASSKDNAKGIDKISVVAYEPTRIMIASTKTSSSPKRNYKAEYKKLQAKYQKLKSSCAQRKALKAPSTKGIVVNVPQQPAPVVNVTCPPVDLSGYVKKEDMEALRKQVSELTDKLTQVTEQLEEVNARVCALERCQTQEGK